MKYERIEAPLSEPELIHELLGVWKSIFKMSFEELRPILEGDECSENVDVIFLAREGGELAGTSHLTISKAVTALAGLGEVATSTSFRRRGIGEKLCQMALDEFRQRRGQSIFLGTSNPDAARLYHRLGWRRLPGTNVMLNLLNNDSPEPYLVDYFRGLDGSNGPKVVVGTASPDVRIPMIPLCIVPHDWQVLDANARMYSIRFHHQGGCMSLYPMYQAVRSVGKGEWFAARTEQGKVVGLASARLGDSNEACIDGFAHRNFAEILEALVRSAVAWAQERNAASCYALISAEDEEKQKRFASMGFLESREGQIEFELGGRQIRSLRMELS